MIRAFKNLIDALLALERKLAKHPALRHEAATIRAAFQNRMDALRSLRKRLRPKRPVKPKMLIELFMPDLEGGVFSEMIDVNSAQGLRSLEWWSDIYNGTA